MGLSPPAYVLRVVARVRSAELEQALLLLPFTDALRLMAYLVVWLRQGAQVRAGREGRGGKGRGRRAAVRPKCACSSKCWLAEFSVCAPPHFSCLLPPSSSPIVVRRWSCCAAWPRCCCACTCSS